MLTNPIETVRSTILRALASKPSAARYGAREIDEECNLVELGIIDSEDLVDIILEVEEQCRCEFNPEAVNMENGLTLRSLVSAFVVRA